MADRCCSLCGTYYTDEEKHNYDICVSRCSDHLKRTKDKAHSVVNELGDAYEHYIEAVRIQRQTWWK